MGNIAVREREGQARWELGDRRVGARRGRLAGLAAHVEPPPARTHGDRQVRGERGRELKHTCANELPGHGQHLLWVVDRCA